ncbi:MAG: hypothetical protein JSW10_10200 [Pseudomonadota bacterium]|nr:MAG: hypothetical protein JSW10_10200 [Pseudomonadota bacterium]
MRKHIVYLFMLLVAGCGGDDSSDNANQPGTLQFDSTSYDVTEGTDGYVNIIVTRSGGRDGAASVDYTTADDNAVAGSDYAAMNGTLDWPDGLSGNLTISIAITDDNTEEPSESFTVALSNATLAALGKNTSAIVNIIDDD